MRQIFPYFLVHLLKGKKVDTVLQNWNYVNELSIHGWKIKSVFLGRLDKNETSS